MKVAFIVILCISYFFKCHHLYCQLGVRADGLKDLFAGKIPQLTKDLGISDLAALLKIVSISVSDFIYGFVNHYINF